MEITDLNNKMLEPWDGVEAPVTMFARADKYVHQLERHYIPKQSELHLLYAVSTYQISGQFDAAMQEWHAKTLANKTFPNFRVYIQNEYTKQVKHNRLTAGSVRKGIANKATEVPEQKFLDAEAQAMVIAEVANVLQAQNKQQMKNMMGMFEKLLTSMQSSGSQLPLSHPKLPPIANPAWDVPTATRSIATTRSAGNSMPTKLPGRKTGSPPRVLDGVWRMSPLSSGGRVRLKSIK